MNFQEVYDAFGAKVAAIIGTDHKELTDNTVIENNKEQLLALGYCLEWTESENTERALDCIWSVKQNVVVVLTIDMRASDQNITARKAAERAILENCYRLVKAIEADPQIGGQVEKAFFSGHNGVELVVNQDSKAFLMVQSNYQLEWFRNKE